MDINGKVAIVTGGAQQSIAPIRGMLHYGAHLGKRLGQIGRELGVVDERRWALFERKREAIAREQRRLDGILVRPADIAAADRELLGRDLQRESTAADLLRRPELGYRNVTRLTRVGPMDQAMFEHEEQAEQVELAIEVRAKYAGYIDRQQDEIERLRRHENTPLPTDLDYAQVDGLSNEVRQKLAEARPDTLARASRIPGVTVKNSDPQTSRISPTSRAEHTTPAAGSGRLRRAQSAQLSFKN